MYNYVSGDSTISSSKPCPAEELRKAVKHYDLLLEVNEGKISGKDYYWEAIDLYLTIKDVLECMDKEEAEKERAFAAWAKELGYE